MTHICVSDLTIIGSDNGLSPGRRQPIIGTNAGILLIRLLGTNFNEVLVEILIFSFKKMRLKVLSAKRRPCCLGLNVLKLASSTRKAANVLCEPKRNCCVYGIYMIYIGIDKTTPTPTPTPIFLGWFDALSIQIPRQQKSLDRHQLDINPTLKCWIDI